MTGFVNSFQSMGAVDGPGLRFIVFMQGCPLRCAYCHNPDTWEFGTGQEVTVDEIVQKLRRVLPYIKKKGGITVSGGEPLMQAKFITELFRQCRELGVHTALDTSGIGNLDDARELLGYTDLVLCDVKFLTPEEYSKYAKADFDKVLKFLELCKELDTPMWVRHVVVPTLTDSEEHCKALCKFLSGYKNLEKLEFLAFRKICLPKYANLGLEFPLEDIPECPKDKISEFCKIAESFGIPI